MKLSGRTAIMGILVFAGRELTAPQIIALAAPLGMTATNVKSYLTRMVAEGSLTRRGAARLSFYEPSSVQHARIDDLRQRMTPMTDPWDSSWVVVAGFLPKDRMQKERLNSALWIDGFRMVNGAFLRPAWPLPWALERARWYADLMEGVCVRGHLETAPEYLRDLFGVSGLDAEAAVLAEKLDEIGVPDSPRGCYAAMLELTGEVVQLLSHNPRFPPELVSGEGLRNLAESFRKLEASLAPGGREFLATILGE
ncbi:transcriptional regulator, PaaX family protein [Fimbriimonas ginsengisoli Gsoil 348]|uniref:Transcriptional regulator, PaaX family protein n=2 Tax=Fimbriimonas ginsengisoli TaxID=1005039 RepID=A0A068NPZ9_FIMGI|nr:transcriptional regulator, PaaX family protein [Fimbriimonas ginsengisoli Gsoil 348]